VIGLWHPPADGLAIVPAMGQRKERWAGGIPDFLRSHIEPRAAHVVADEVAVVSEEVLTITARRSRDPSGLVNPGAATTSSMWHV